MFRQRTATTSCAVAGAGRSGFAPSRCAPLWLLVAQSPFPAACAAGSPAMFHDHRLSRRDNRNTFLSLPAPAQRQNYLSHQRERAWYCGRVEASGGFDSRHLHNNEQASSLNLAAAASAYAGLASPSAELREQVQVYRTRQWIVGGRAACRVIDA